LRIISFPEVVIYIYIVVVQMVIYCLDLKIVTATDRNDGVSEF